MKKYEVFNLTTKEVVSVTEATPEQAVQANKDFRYVGSPLRYRIKIPPMPRHHLEVTFLGEDTDKKKRIYIADHYQAAVSFTHRLQVWGTITPHNGGAAWKIEL